MHIIVLWHVLHCIHTGITVAVTIRDIPVSKLHEYRLIEKYSISARHKKKPAAPPLPPTISNSRMTLGSIQPSELFPLR
jgi:hypothetical protein